MLREIAPGAEGLGRQGLLHAGSQPACRQVWGAVWLFSWGCGPSWGSYPLGLTRTRSLGSFLKKHSQVRKRKCWAFKVRAGTGLGEARERASISPGWERTLDCLSLVKLTGCVWAPSHSDLRVSHEFCPVSPAWPWHLPSASSTKDWHHAQTLPTAWPSPATVHWGHPTTRRSAHQRLPCWSGVWPHLSWLDITTVFRPRLWLCVVPWSLQWEP